MNSKKKMATTAIREQVPQTHFREHSTPLFMTSSFTFPSGEEMANTFAGETDANIYSRYSNPNIDEFISKVCRMEGADEGFATASGMAAIFASLASLLSAGDHVIATRAVFGSTHQILTQILSKWGITHSYVEPNYPEDWDKFVQPNTKLLLVETPSNPGLTLVDLSRAGGFAKQHDLIFVVDNCFATPYIQQPIRYGADLVVHSATKWMDGQGRSLGGVIVGSKAMLEKVTFFCRHTGPAMSPFNAWLISKSLETLAIRMEAHSKHAIALASWLEEQAPIESVSYPFLDSHAQHQLAKKQMKLGGGIITCKFKGGAKAAMKAINALQICSRTSNLGDTRTIVTHPTSTTHSKLTEEERLQVGITPGLLRISVGLEAPEDIIDDFRQAFKVLS